MRIIVSAFGGGGGFYIVHRKIAFISFYVEMHAWYLWEKFNRNFHILEACLILFTSKEWNILHYVKMI